MGTFRKLTLAQYIDAITANGVEAETHWDWDWTRYFEPYQKFAEQLLADPCGTMLDLTMVLIRLEPGMSWTDRELDREQVVLPRFIEFAKRFDHQDVLAALDAGLKLVMVQKIQKPIPTDQRTEANVESGWWREWFGHIAYWGRRAGWISFSQTSAWLSEERAALMAYFATMSIVAAGQSETTTPPVDRLRYMMETYEGVFHPDAYELIRDARK